jgi:diguanylate cyclase (GGDEF)-like protein/PAS domain S-box-containing protein
MDRKIGKVWRLPAVEQIGADQLSAILHAMPASLLGGLVNSVIVTAALWDAISAPLLLAWLGASVCLALILFPRSRSPVADRLTISRRALRKAVCGAFLSALPWTLIVSLCLGRVPHSVELILIAICAGMAASGSVFLAPVFPAAIAYMATILAPATIVCFLLPGYFLLGLLTLSYTGFLFTVIAAAARLSVDRTQVLRALTHSTRLLQERDALISTQNTRFETAVNNTNQGICFFDRDERLIVCNRLYIDMYGLDPERVRPGVSLSEIVSMRYAAGACPDISKDEYLAWRSRAGNAERPSDTVYRLKNGRIFAIHYRPMTGGAWVATTDDITERQQLTEELAQQHALMQERTALLQAIIDNFPGGIGLYDKDLRVVVCNDTAKAILDLPERFFAGRAPRLEDILRFNAERGEYGPGDVKEHVRAKLALIVEQGSYRFERSRPDGTVLDVRGAPVENVGFLTTYMDITERYRAEAKIAHMAMHDPLTGLPNRVLFRERLDKALGTTADGNVALLMLDLNRFKQVNDTLGHPMGDRLLQAVANRLAQAVRVGDTLARLGGDEFAVVLKSLDAIADATLVANRIQQSLREPFALEEHTVCIDTSIGIAIASATAADAERLIKEADMALYRAKAEGGHRFGLLARAADWTSEGQLLDPERLSA